MQRMSLAVVLLVFALALSCRAADQLRITFVTPLLAHPVWLEAKEGFEKAGKDYNFDAAWVGPQGVDVNEMVNLVEIAIAEKVDGIVTMALNPSAMIEVFKKAEAAGIPVLLVDSDATDAPRFAFLGLDPTETGDIGAQVLLKALKGKKIFGAGIVPTITSPFLMAIQQAYQDALAKNPDGFQHVVIVESNSDMLKAIQEWENVFSTYPEVNALYCNGAETAPAAAKVIDERNLKGKVAVVGIDALPETLDGIRNDLITGTLAVNFYRYGYQAGQMLADFKRKGVKPAEVVIPIPPIVVTKENVDTFAKDMRNPATYK